MASDTQKRITDEQIKLFRSILEQYEPYDIDDPILERYDDSSVDENRFNATLAKKALMDNGISLT